MIAPTPVSALLHAVAVVKAGVFTIVKVIIYIFGVDYLSELVSVNWYSGQWLIWIAAFSIIVASMLAVQQDNLKLRLAYSTVSQLSYIVLAVAMLTPSSIAAASFHIAAHAVSKITLFFAAGSIYTASGKKNISQLSGIGRKMPLTMIAFSVAAFSMIGIPPAVGFLSKWYMLTGAFEGHLYFVIVIIIISTLLNCAYFLPVIYKAFFEKEKVDGKSKQHGEAPFPIVIALTITMLAVIALFVYPGVFLELSLRVGL
jgi:multicomponent Na+:H+ antiporter subunit D